MPAPSFRDRWNRLVGFLKPPPRGPVTLAEALPWLMPKVRPRFLHEAMALESGRPGAEFRPLAGNHVVSLVVDHPDGELDVGPAHLERWDAGFEPLFQRARANLAARSGADNFQSFGPGLYRSRWRDRLDGSRLLLPGVLRGLSLEGDPVALLPNRDTLLVVGSEDPDGLGWALRAALGHLDEDPGALHGCPLRLRGFQWEPFQAGEGAACRPLLDRFRHRCLAAEYARQKHLLDRRHGLAGSTGVTVAPLQLEPSPDGPARSFTVWSPSMGETWLPKADRIHLAGSPGPSPARIPWDRLAAGLGPRLEPVGLFPERYRLIAPPEPGLLEGLGG
jgi:hypothetical protein